jgi:hypothetical protein
MDPEGIQHTVIWRVEARVSIFATPLANENSMLPLKSLSETAEDVNGGAISHVRFDFTAPTGMVKNL